MFSLPVGMRLLRRLPKKTAEFAPSRKPGPNQQKTDSNPWPKAICVRQLTGTRPKPGPRYAGHSRSAQQLKKGRKLPAIPA